MCGIYLSLSRRSHVSPSQNLINLLRQRGPGYCRVQQFQSDLPISAARTAHKDQICMTAAASVLPLRGDHVYSQPITSPEGSYLCWNGEAWRIDGTDVVGNDSIQVFALLIAATVGVQSSESTTSGSAPVGGEHIVRVAKAMRRVSGPYAFIFFDAQHQTLFFGRDCLGRRSLLRGVTQSGSFILSSVADRESQDVAWEEVESDGIHVLDLSVYRDSGASIKETLTANSEPTELPYIVTLTPSNLDPASEVSIPLINRDLPSSPAVPTSDCHSLAVSELEQQLVASVEARVLDIFEPHVNGKNDESSGKVGILFSGGLDCTVLARIAADLLDSEVEIHLINVAFENPRVIAAAQKSKTGASSTQPEISPYELCPDRITGRRSYQELQLVCGASRWVFVSVNVTYADVTAHRQQIIDLMLPHNTEMDFSIGCALYFAARGIGDKESSNFSSEHSYKNPTRVLISGLGADELFGGYTRHATAYSRRGHPGLCDELALDIGRLGKRNLGRDDRVTSHWAKETRYPFLDEKLVRWAMECPAWEKTGFGQHSTDGIEPGKRVLRLLARRLGLLGVACEPKRAIQFGARTAKMASGRTKGTQIVC